MGRGARAADSGYGMRVTAGFFCDRAYRMADGRVVAAGIVPGLVEVRVGEEHRVDAVLHLSHDEDGALKWQLRVTVGISVIMQTRVTSEFKRLASVAVEVNQIPYRHDSGAITVDVRERGGDWTRAATLNVAVSKEPPRNPGVLHA